MKSESQTEGIFQFAVDTNLISELGDRLVARPSIALAELIKNAYDADATKVTVLFHDVTGSDGCIIVQDNGTGMTFEAIRDKWMRIATTDKLSNPVSPTYGRDRTGAKGIGRFAAGRLAHRLTLNSVAKRSDQTLESIDVIFDWSRDFGPGKELDQVPVSYERRLAFDGLETGVILQLEDLKDSWTDVDIRELRRDLLGLIDPIGPTPLQHEAVTIQKGDDPGFSVNLETPEFPELEGELSEFVKAGAWSTLTGRIADDGTVNYSIDIHEVGETRTFNLDESDGDFQRIVGTSFVVHYFIYQASQFTHTDMGVREMVRYAKEHAGVRIYLDGFRVFGYGEPGNDWLGLDEMRGQRTRGPTDLVSSLELEARGYALSPFLRISGNNQLFGAVRLSQSHHTSAQHGIEINIARDRLVENESFELLKSFVRNGIFWQTLQYARIEHPNRQEAVPDIPGPLTPQIDQVLATLEETIRSNDALTPGVKEDLLTYSHDIRSRIETHDKVVEERDKQLIDEISMLRALASVGTLVSFLNHQLRLITDNLGRKTAILELYVNELDESSRGRYLDTIGSLRSWRKYVQQQVDLLTYFLGQKSRTELQPSNVCAIMDDVIQALEGYAADYGIEIQNLLPKNLWSPPMFSAELYAIVVNIFSNALKAVRTCPERKIEVRGSTQEKKIIIQMLDSGRGLNIPRDKAFSPFETTSLPDAVLGEGTGLGLYIVRELVGNYGGNVKFVDAPDPWQTCIQIELPKS